MRIIKLYLIVLFAITFLSFCQRSYNNINPAIEKKVLTNQEGKSKFKISVTDTTIIPLDEYSVPFNRSVDYFTKNDTSYYSFYNELNNSIYIYNLSTKSLKHKISLSEEFDGKPLNITGHTIKNIDSLIVYDFNNQILLWCDIQGNFKKATFLKEKLNRKKIQYPPSPKGWTSMPIIIDNNKIIMAGYSTGEMQDETQNNRPTTIIYNERDSTANYYGFYPRPYQNGNWGGAHLRRVYYTYNYQKNALVYSFPINHYVFKTTLSTEDTLQKFYAGSQKIKKISSLSVAKGIAFPKSWRREHFADNYSYSMIIFDPYKNKYYRFAEKKIQNYEDDLYKEKIIVGLDEKLTKIFEFDLSTIFKEKIYLYGIYVSKEGLNLQLLDGNEDYIKIVTINFLRK